MQKENRIARIRRWGPMGIALGLALLLFSYNSSILSQVAPEPVDVEVLTVVTGGYSCTSSGYVVGPFPLGEEPEVILFNSHRISLSGTPGMPARSVARRRSAAPRGRIGPRPDPFDPSNNTTGALSVGVDFEGGTLEDCQALAQSMAMVAGELGCLTSQPTTRDLSFDKRVTFALVCEGEQRTMVHTMGELARAVVSAQLSSSGN